MDEIEQLRKEIEELRSYSLLGLKAKLVKLHDENMLFRGIVTYYKVVATVIGVILAAITLSTIFCLAALAIKTMLQISFFLLPIVVAIPSLYLLYKVIR